MKSLIIGFLCLLLSGCCKGPTITLKEFVSLIPEWEVPPNSPPTIIGDNGDAYGLYQIHEIMVMDYNRITGDNAVHSDVFDPEFSKRLAYAVLLHYTKQIQAQGITPTVDHLLFIWNGGGGAWRRVNHPLPDQKQTNLNRYKARAWPILLRSVSNKPKAL